MANTNRVASASVTFVSRERTRACENFGKVDLMRTETVHTDGRVVWSLRGVCDDEQVGERGERQADASLSRPIDLASVISARLRSGWTVSQ